MNCRFRRGNYHSAGVGELFSRYVRGRYKSQLNCLAYEVSYRELNTRNGLRR